MDNKTARQLVALNNRFYAEHAASFSATRGAPWAGWQRVVQLFEEHLLAHPQGRSASVADLACGNLRFEAYCEQQLERLDPTYHAVDACPDLLAHASALRCAARIRPRQLDILDTLLAGRDLAEALALPPCDLAVSFGFMHHIPGTRTREAYLWALCDLTLPGGLIALSFWRFMDDERLARKARHADAAAERTLVDPAALEDGDHFLGWQADASPQRFCHHFTEAEIDALAASAGTRAREVARWAADGASGTLNRYLVLERL